jgi:hypothetical protein
VKNRSLLAMASMMAMLGTKLVPHGTERPVAIIHTPRNHEQRIRKAKEKRERRKAARLVRAGR